jgi:DNA invertase Pin-like site-specific DNA recombinase
LAARFEGAREQLRSFAAERGLTIAAWYTENESGAKLSGPELFRLLADAHPGDILLVKQIDRLSCLTAEDWERLKSELTARRVRVLHQNCGPKISHGPVRKIRCKSLRLGEPLATL